jgi:hypothetical protein
VALLPGAEDADECVIGDADVGGVGKPRGWVPAGLSSVRCRGWSA